MKQGTTDAASLRPATSASSASTPGIEVATSGAHSPSTSLAVVEPSADYPTRAFTAEENATFDRITADLKLFDDYERQFQEVLMILENDEVLEAFRAEYDGLHNSFLKSHEGEGRLLRKCVDLQSDIQACIGKAAAADELTLGDRHTIDTLKASIDNTAQKQTNTKDKCAALREKTEQLKKEVQKLERAAAEPVEAVELESTLQSVLHLHESVQRERDSQAYQFSSLQNEVSGLERKLQKLRESQSSQDAELLCVRRTFDATQSEMEGYVQRKMQKEAELRALRDDLTKRRLLISERQRRADELNNDHAKHDEQIRRINEETDVLSDEYQTLCRQLQHTKSALQDCNEENDVLQRRVRDALTALQQQQSAVTESRKQYLKESKLLEALQRRNVVAEEARAEAERRRDAAQEALRTKEAALQHALRLVGADEQQLNGLHRERNLLFQDHLTAEAQTRRNELWLAEKRSQLHHCESQLVTCESHMQRESEVVYKATQEYERYEAQTKRHALTCTRLLAEVQVCERQLAEEHAAMGDIEQRLQQQHVLLDTVVSDRDAYAKHYSQLRNELVEMNRNFGVVLGQIEQLKIDIVRRERDVVREEEAVATLQRQRTEIENGIASVRRRTEKKRHTVDRFNIELRKLTDVLSDANDEAARQRRKCRDVVHERDLLNAQSVERGKELVALYEKVHTQQGLLQRTEAMYRDRESHLDQLEYQSAQLEQQLTQMQQFAERLPELQRLVHAASKELRREKVNARALLDECERPLNLHPSHVLRWSEPETAALSDRVVHLQRELASREQTLAATERAIAQQEKEYLEAKAVVARQPGPEVAQQLSAYQTTLVKKQGQMRQVQESLQFFREQTELYRHRHDELRERLAAMAKEYAEQREETERRERQQIASAAARGTSNDGGEAQEEDVVYSGYVAPPLPP